MITGSNYALTKSGSGTLELSGANTFSAGAALTSKTDSFGVVPNTDKTVTYSSAYTSGVDSLAVITDINNDFSGGYRDNFTSRIVSTSNVGFTYRINRLESDMNVLPEATSIEVSP